MHTLPAIGAILALTISASAGTLPDPQMVRACLSTDLGDKSFTTLPYASAGSSRIFATIGIRLEWTEDRRYCNGDSGTIRLTVRQHAPSNTPASWMAYALPYDRTHIIVFYDRVADSAGLWVNDMLAHVFAHEITHVLQGISRHSTSGIMKPTWDRADLAQMTQKTLQFTPYDIELIHDGILDRARKLAAACHGGVK